MIPFTTPFRSARDLDYVAEALDSGITCGDGPFTQRAAQLLQPLVGGGDVLLTTSCTHALDMTAILLGLSPGDEVILPSFTFSSTANAYVLRGATPVFVDCRNDTFNIDETKIEAALTDKTKAIVVMHYGGVACEMDTIMSIAKRHNLPIIEDNAHGLGGSYRGRALGSFGVMATQSFHSTKNISCGEGGALVLNDPSLLARAEILREKGTDRSQFFRGVVDKYRWVDVGSSFLPSEVNAALLTSQLESFDFIQQRRQAIWHTYQTSLSDWAHTQNVQLPFVPEGVTHPAHVFQMLLPSEPERDRFIAHMRGAGILTPFHYVPLHSAPAGRRYGRAASPDDCSVSSDVASRLVRLPLFAGLDDTSLEFVIATAHEFKTR